MSWGRLLSGALAVALSVPAFAGSPGSPATPPNVSVAREVHRDVSRPMRDIVAEMGAPRVGDPAEHVVPNRILDFSDLFPGAVTPAVRSDSVQRAPSGNPVPVPTVSVDGLRAGESGGFVPPDTTGDVGPTTIFNGSTPVGRCSTRPLARGFQGPPRAAASGPGSAAFAKTPIVAIRWSCSTTSHSAGWSANSLSPVPVPLPSFSASRFRPRPTRSAPITATHSATRYSTTTARWACG